MEILRLIVTGAPGVGKSTFIRSISELEVVNPNRKATERMTLLEKETTATFDFGRLKFSPDIVMHLYGPPGQAGFDFMWDLLTHRAHACIMLLAAHRPGEFSYSRRLLSFLKQRVNVPVIIGLTHIDHPEAWSMENVILALGCRDGKISPPVVLVNPMEKASVAQTLTVLVEHLTQISQCLTLQSLSNHSGRISQTQNNNWNTIPMVCSSEQAVGGELLLVSGS
ncbi:GTP-binding protein [Allocoleopsis franciscana]|uniref:Putative GTPase n=1 Tax=Allocoleopsis franciscana PCC 7113 TaxID=1173027 RepID=K9WAB2_9CYAN|nr:GTPase [Allocoleopsis franciscana]AFZ17163.1 putative GTPase [Allocoleopsis franciscana PCC 7113]